MENRTFSPSWKTEQKSITDTGGVDVKGGGEEGKVVVPCDSTHVCTCHCTRVAVPNQGQLREDEPPPMPHRRVAGPWIIHICIDGRRTVGTDGNVGLPAAIVADVGEACARRRREV